MTEEEQRQFEKQVVERVEAVRDVFTGPALALKPEDEPALVFNPETAGRDS